MHLFKDRDDYKENPQLDKLIEDLKYLKFVISVLSKRVDSLEKKIEEKLEG